MLRRTVFALSAVVAVVGAGFAQETSKALTRPDGKPADHSKKVKVFILLGQSNMLGFGRVGPKETKGTLEYMIKQKGKYGFLVDDAGLWTGSSTRDDRDVHAQPGASPGRRGGGATGTETALAPPRTLRANV